MNRQFYEGMEDDARAFRDADEEAFEHFAAESTTDAPRDPQVSETMLFLLEHSREGALKRIAELERDRERIELIDDPVLAPNLRIGEDAEGNTCWKIGGDEAPYATVREALDAALEIAEAEYQRQIEDEDRADANSY